MNYYGQEGQDKYFKVDESTKKTSTLWSLWSTYCGQDKKFKKLMKYFGQDEYSMDLMKYYGQDEYFMDLMKYLSKVAERILSNF